MAFLTGTAPYFLILGCEFRSEHRAATAFEDLDATGALALGSAGRVGRQHLHFGTRGTISIHAPWEKMGGFPSEWRFPRSQRDSLGIFPQPDQMMMFEASLEQSPQCCCASRGRNLEVPDTCQRPLTETQAVATCAGYVACVLKILTKRIRHIEDYVVVGSSSLADRASASGSRIESLSPSRYEVLSKSKLRWFIGWVSVGF